MSIMQEKNKQILFNLRKCILLMTFSMKKKSFLLPKISHLYFTSDLINLIVTFCHLMRFNIYLKKQNP